MDNKLDISNCSVSRNRIIKFDKRNGLVKLSYIEFNRERAKVSIKDCINKRIREFNVLRDNIENR